MKTTQKTHRRNSRLLSLLGAAAMLAGAVWEGSAATWTGASPTASKLWSDTNNWDTLLAPTPWDAVILANGGSTNVPGAVNNVISANTTITNLTYSSKVSFISLATNYHTTLINPGVTLTIDRGTTGGSMIYVGDVTDPLNHDNQYYYTVKGLGASLIAGNVSAPSTNQGLQVTATQRGFTNHIGSLDLSGLDNFALAGGYFWVGINGGESTIPTDRPAGRVYLAKTNLIVITGDYYDGLNLGSFRVGESRANTPSQASLLELGQENAIYTPWLKIGGARTGTNPELGGYMYFRSGLSNPTLKLRGSDGVSRLGTIRISDNSWSTSGSSIGSKGVMDLTGGTVDALVDTMFVGRGPGGNDTKGATSGANGTLTLSAGTFDVNAVSVGYQYGNNASTNSGTINVISPNAKFIVDRMTLARDAGANAGGGVGVLNIDGGTVEVKTYLSDSGDNAASTIILTNNGLLNLQAEGDTTPATVTVDAVNFSSGKVNNGTLVLGGINVFSPATAFPLDGGTVLTPGPAGAVGTLTVSGGLALKGGTLSFDVSNSGYLDQINVSGDLDLSGGGFVQVNPLYPIAAGTYPLMTYGSLTGTGGSLAAAGPIADSRYTVAFDTTAPTVSMTVGGAAANLLWSGGNNGNAWDLKTTANWNSGADKFYAYDAVEFGDAGSSTPAVNLVGTLYPGSVAFSANSKDYTFAGTGKISGLCGLTLSGSSTLTVLTTNDYKGTTEINAGTLALGNGATADGALGSGTVNNYATLAFNPAGTQTHAGIIAGTGTVLKRGPGVTKLSGANTFTGPVTVEAGTLQAGSAAALGDAVSGGMATINSGATLDIGGQALGAKPVTVSGAGVDGAGAIINSGAAQANALRDVQLAGATTFGGIGSWSISSASATSADPGLTAYGYKLTKVGASQVTILCLRAAPWNLDLGEVDVQEGSLSLQGNLNLGSAVTQPITVRSNATLVLVNYGGVTLTKAYSLEDGSCFHGRGTNSAVDGSITLQGKVIFDTLNNAINLVNCAVSGNGSLVKGIGNHPATGTSTGTGTLLLAGANTFSGDLRVETGTVALTNSATLACPNIVLAGGTLSVSNRSDSTLTLNSGQSLKGSGNVTGVISSPEGSTVAPAPTNGLLAVSGNLTLRGTTRMDVNRTGTTTNSSRITVSGTLDCGGSLVLTSSGEPLQAGDTFKLFQAATTLNPFQTSAITWPSLASGLYWTNRLAEDGTVAVASNEPTTPPTLSYNLSGGGASLLVSWPVAYTSYVLQAQTNAPGVGLTVNWTTVTTTGNQFTLPINPANGSVFLRLLKQ